MSVQAVLFFKNQVLSYHRAGARGRVLLQQLLLFALGCQFADIVVNLT